MKAPDKLTELFLPVWPLKRTPWEAIGNADYGATQGCTLEAIMIHLRARPTNDKVYEHGDNFRVFSDLAIKLWVYGSGEVQVEAKISEVYGGDLAYAKLLVKKLTWLDKNLPLSDRWRVESLGDHMVELCKALGITRCIKYGMSHDPEFAPVGEAIDLIVKEVVRRNARHERKAA